MKAYSIRRKNESVCVLPFSQPEICSQRKSLIDDLKKKRSNRNRNSDGSSVIEVNVFFDRRRLNLFIDHQSSGSCGWTPTLGSSTSLLSRFSLTSRRSFSFRPRVTSGWYISGRFGVSSSSVSQFWLFFHDGTDVRLDGGGLAQGPLDDVAAQGSFELHLQVFDLSLIDVGTLALLS